MITLHAAVGIALLLTLAVSTLTYFIGLCHGKTDEATRRQRDLRAVHTATKENNR